MKLSWYITKPSRIVLALASRGQMPFISDKCYLNMYYREKTGKNIDFVAPKLFGEKMQWLKLYDHNPKYVTMVDKYAAKAYVAERIGVEHTIPTIGAWEAFDDIDFNMLPNQFVLKCTHDSGGIVICRDKKTFDIELAKKRIEKCLGHNYYYAGREWPYKDVHPRVIAEEYLEDCSTTELRDYKFFCFNGEPAYCQVISNRTSAETIDFYDMSWNHQVFTGLGLPSKPFSNAVISKPLTFEQMVCYSRILSSGISFLRVDFYEVNGKLYFGELTFYPASGFGEFTPNEWNKKLGDMIVLPETERK